MMSGESPVKDSISKIPYENTSGMQIKTGLSFINEVQTVPLVSNYL